MIDLHAHFLPGMDDGSRSPQESEQMLRESYDQGVDVIVASSHFYAHRQNPQRFLEKRQKALERISYDASAMPKILMGAEVAYYDGLSRSEDIRKLCIGQSDLLLVEMPFAPWTERCVGDICALPKQLEIIPVLAHIERYFRFISGTRLLERLYEAGVHFQCNGEFFLSPIRSLRAMKMLRGGLVHFLGSDCHGMDHRVPNLAAAAERIRRKAGQETLEKLDHRSRSLLGLGDTSRAE